MLEQISGDPEPRTRFIATFPSWYVSWDGFIDILKTCDSPHAHSGLCCALAEVPVREIPPTVRGMLEPVVVDLANNHADPGVHSAAGLVLRRWSVEQPLDETVVERQREMQADIDEQIASANRNVA